MRAFFTAALIATVAGGLAGGLAAAGAGRNVQTTKAPWTEPTPPQSAAEDEQRLYEQLMATNHFGEASSAAIDQIAAASDGGVPPPPRIAATTLKDGKIAVTVYAPGDGIVTVGVGDTLPGGWVVKEASLDRITIALDDQNLEIVVFPHDNPDS